MRATKKGLAVFAGTLVALVALALPGDDLELAAATPVAVTVPSEPTVQVKQEDELGWDCRVDGNADCGSPTLARALAYCDESHEVEAERWACWNGAYESHLGGVEEWETYDGHANCVALIGETTYVRCSDGYTTST